MNPNKERFARLGLTTLTLLGLAGCASSAENTNSAVAASDGSSKSTLVVEKTPEAPFVQTGTREVKKEIVEYGSGRIPEDITQELAKSGETAEKVTEVSLISPDGQKVGFSFVETSDSDYVAFRNTGGKVSISEYSANAEVNTKTGQVFVGFRTIETDMVGKLFLEFGLDVKIPRLPNETEADYMDRIEKETEKAYMSGEKVVSVRIVNPAMFDSSGGYREIAVTAPDLITKILDALPHETALAEGMPAEIGAKVAATGTPTIEATKAVGQTVTSTVVPEKGGEKLATSTPNDGEKPIATPGGEVLPGGSVNVRSGPGTEYPIVRSMIGGQKFTVEESYSNGWFKIGPGEYIKADLTKANDSAKVLARVPAPTAEVKPTVAVQTTKVPEKLPVVSAENGGITRPDVLAMMLKQYGSLNNMPGEQLRINGAWDKQDGTNPTFHEVVTWGKLGKELPGSKPGAPIPYRVFEIDMGKGVIKKIAVSYNFDGITKSKIDPRHYGVWGYSFGLYVGADGNPVVHPANVALLERGGSLAEKVSEGMIVGIFENDSANKDTYSPYRMVLPDMRDPYNK